MYHMSDMFVLGIDAGGTKTVCLLADEQGRVLADARGGGANLQASGELAVEKVLYQVMDAVLANREGMPAAICLGIAGVDRPQDTEAMRGIMRRIGFKIPTLIVNDALVALVAGAGEDPGVVLVAGTGSIAYGRNRAGRAARAGGWGYLLGDEGGGFWIGRSALSAVVRQYDGRGPATQLTELVLAHLRLTSPTDLIQEIYEGNQHRKTMAGLASLVGRAAANGDAVASDIVGRAGAELASSVASVIARLEMRGEVFPTLLAGGIFRGIPSLVGDVSARVSEIAPRSEVRRLEVEPAMGAVRLALATAQGRVTVPTYL
jgi:N-acetylglucosamine kinase-like BadF-type ATPase